MSCRFLYFDPLTPMNEWLPMALRDATCLRRTSDPERWNGVLREQGYDVGELDCDCVQNRTSTWTGCPLYRERTS